jgi:hypothetical protein
LLILIKNLINDHSLIHTKDFSSSSKSSGIFLSELFGGSSRGSDTQLVVFVGVYSYKAKSLLSSHSLFIKLYTASLTRSIFPVQQSKGSYFLVQKSGNIRNLALKLLFTTAMKSTEEIFYAFVSGVRMERIALQSSTYKVQVYIHFIVFYSIPGNFHTCQNELIYIKIVILHFYEEVIQKEPTKLEMVRFQLINHKVRHAEICQNTWDQNTAWLDERKF